jgi:serine/threonine protein kinase
VKDKLSFFLRLAAVAAGGAIVIKIVLGTNMDVLTNSESTLSFAIQNAQDFFYHAIVLVTKMIYRILLAALLIFLGVAGMIFIRRRRAARFVEEPATQSQTLGKDMRPAGSSPIDYVPELVGLMEVESFFLDLFRRQLGVSTDAKGFITSAPDKNNRAGRIYTLSVKHNGQWATRHMTIRPVGEISHSKSQCFCVIFDTHMVVKIPPVPIKDFSNYIRRIQRESILVEKLSPLICIIPNLSVILSRVWQLAGVGAIPGKDPAEKYVRLLKAAPEYQSCLRIGGAFVFFMDLSRHFFLSDVLVELHDVEGEIQKTIASDSEIFFYSYDFEIKYGPENAQVCLDLQDKYDRFESGLATCMIQPNERILLSDKRKREWFFAHLSGESISIPPSSEFTDAFMTEVNSLLQEIAPLSEATVRMYQKIVRDHAGQLVFNRSRSQFEAMIRNILDLLLVLEEKRVSHRDLKPDNLIVAGKTDNYPLFLLSADGYSIGLIDLETAVAVASSENEPMMQPHLAGTPAYATPSHFAMNDLLIEIHGNLTRIFHLQDWYAIVGILYEIITGHRLFLKTGNLIPGLIQTLQQARTECWDLKAVYLAVNEAFWKSARSEFAQKTEEYRSRLEKVMVRVPIALVRHFENYDATQPEKMNHPLLPDRPEDLSITLSAKHLLDLMFEIVVGTMDVKYLSCRNDNKNEVDAFPENQSDDCATCSIGYTLTGIIQKGNEQSEV